MKNLIIFVTSVAIASSSALQATQISFTAEVGSLVVDSTTIDKSNSTGLTAMGFFIAEGSAFTNFTGADAWGITGNTLTTAQLSDIVALISGTIGFARAEPLPLIPEFVPTFAVIRETLDSTAAGFHPVFLLHTAADLNSLVVGDSFGVVTTTFSTPANGSQSIGFNGARQWDIFLLGQSGSLTLATVVPEPSAFATIAGLMTLGFVMVRRRRA